MKKKYALVTGGSRGIGRATCVKLAEMGYNVLVNYKGNQQAAAETAALCREKEVEAEILCFDVANAVDVKNVLGKKSVVTSPQKIQHSVKKEKVQDSSDTSVVADLMDMTLEKKS